MASWMCLDRNFHSVYTAIKPSTLSIELPKVRWSFSHSRLWRWNWIRGTDKKPSEFIDHVPAPHLSRHMGLIGVEWHGGDCGQNLRRQINTTTLEIDQLFFLFPYFNHSDGFLMFLNCDLQGIVAKEDRLFPRWAPSIPPFHLCGASLHLYANGL